MEEIGVVKEIKDKLALVGLEAAGPGPARSGPELWARNLASAKTGDRVQVSIPEPMPGARSVAIYALPLLSILIGAGIGKWISLQSSIYESTEAMIGKSAASLVLRTDNPSLVLGAIFLILGFGVLKIWISSILKNKKISPDLVRVLGDADGKGD